MHMNAHLFFDGKCAEALAFYEKALGAKVLMRMSYDQSPVPVSGDRKGQVMHARFAGPVMATGIGRGGAGQRLGQLGGERLIVALDPALPSDQDMVGARYALFRQQITRERSQPALHPVANDRVSDLLGDGEADANRSVTVIPRADLQHEAGHRHASPAIGREEIAAAGQRRDYADSFLRPRARRARITARPPGVAIRERKP